MFWCRNCIYSEAIDFVLHKSVRSTKQFINSWHILNLVKFRGQHWLHAKYYVISSVLSPFLQLSHTNKLLRTEQCCPSCNIHGVLNTQRKFTLPVCLDAAFPILNYLLVLLLLLLSSSSSSSSSLCRVFKHIYLRQTMSLGNTVFQLFCYYYYYLWCLYR